MGAHKVAKYLYIVYMKVKAWQIFLIIILFFLILVNVLYSTYNVVPYTPDSVFLKQYPYEGFDGEDVSGGVPPPPPPPGPSAGVGETVQTSSAAGSSIPVINDVSLNIAPAPNKSSSIDTAGSATSPSSLLSTLMNKFTGSGSTGGGAYTGASQSGVATDAKPSVPVKGGSTTGIVENMKNNKEGYANLEAGSATDEQNYMYLANISASNDCRQKSLGLSNSTGYLCLSQDQINYLMQRGGNSTGRTDF